LGVCRRSPPPGRERATALLKEAVFVHHLPFVQTVIFIATPHGGSYRASLTVAGLFTRLGTGFAFAAPTERGRK
jgi:hypothetical protein